jgi:hypothetical protein
LRRETVCGRKRRVATELHQAGFDVRIALRLVRFRERVNGFTELTARDEIVDVRDRGRR